MVDEEWLDAGAADLEDGVAVARDVGGHLVMVTRFKDRVYVTDAVCPHKFAMLTEGTIADGCVTCPQHEATFDLTTGDAGDDASWAGRLPVHASRIEDGRLMVRLTPS